MNLTIHRSVIQKMVGIPTHDLFKIQVHASNDFLKKIKLTSCKMLLKVSIYKTQYLVSID